MSAAAVEPASTALVFGWTESIEAPVSIGCDIHYGTFDDHRSYDRNASKARELDISWLQLPGERQVGARRTATPTPQASRMPHVCSCIASILCDCGVLLLQIQLEIHAMGATASK